MTSKRGYITLYLSTVAVGILCVEGFNALVDPSALWSPVKGGIERTRVLDAGGRLFTSARLARGDWQSVILGSSRCLRGIDPRSPYFVGLRTFDACLSGTNMAEMAPIAEFALAHNPQLKRVLIGLDFEMFTARRTMSSDYDASMLDRKSTRLNSSH